MFREDETFGELMSELAASGGRLGDESLARLRRVAARVEQLSERTSVVLERFHVSYYALAPEWERLREHDASLLRLGFELALLDLPLGELRTRSYDRADRPEWAAGWRARYGSEEAALEALATSQRRRREALSLTTLPSRTFDTTSRDFAAVARALASAT